MNKITISRIWSSRYHVPGFLYINSVPCLQFLGGPCTLTADIHCFEKAKKASFHALQESWKTDKECPTHTKVKVLKILKYLNIRLYSVVENHSSFLCLFWNYLQEVAVNSLTSLREGNIHLLLCRFVPRFSNTHHSSIFPYVSARCLLVMVCPFPCVSLTVKRKHILQQPLRYFKLITKYL